MGSSFPQGLLCLSEDFPGALLLISLIMHRRSKRRREGQKSVSAQCVLITHMSSLGQLPLSKVTEHFKICPGSHDEKVTNWHHWQHLKWHFLYYAEIFQSLKTKVEAAGQFCYFDYNYAVFALVFPSIVSKARYSLVVIFFLQSMSKKVIKEWSCFI